MSGLHRLNRARPRDSAVPAPAPTPSVERHDEPQTPTPVPRTRVGAAWLAICATALVFVVLIVFMLQNTRSAEVRFLVWHGTLPLALALLIAGVGSAILTMAIGTARITQLRRFSTRQPRPARR